MTRFTTLAALASALALAACASDANAPQQSWEEDGLTCTRVDHDLLGSALRVNLDVDVTFESWITKDGDTDDYVGFALNTDARFRVMAGDELFEGEGSSWQHPSGTTGDAIVWIDLCDAGDGDDGHEDGDGHGDGGDDGDGDGTGGGDCGGDGGDTGDCDDGGDSGGDGGGDHGDGSGDCEPTDDGGGTGDGGDTGDGGGGGTGDGGGDPGDGGGDGGDGGDDGDGGEPDPDDIILY